MTISFKHIIQTFIILIALVFSKNTFSQYKIWNQPTGGDWHTALNWAPPGVPTASDDVYITAGNCNINGDASCANMVIYTSLSIESSTLTSNQITVPSSGCTINISGSTTIQTGAVSNEEINLTVEENSKFNVKCSSSLFQISGNWILLAESNTTIDCNKTVIETDGFLEANRADFTTTGDLTISEGEATFIFSHTVSINGDVTVDKGNLEFINSQCSIKNDVEFTTSIDESGNATGSFVVDNSTVDITGTLHVENGPIEIINEGDVICTSLDLEPYNPTGDINNDILLSQGGLSVTNDANIDIFLHKGRWQAFIPPFSDMIVSDFFLDHNPEVYLTTFHQGGSANSFTYLTNLNAPLAMEGYNMWIEESGTTQPFSLNGNLFVEQNSTPSFSFSLSDDDYTSTDDGWNFVGNPFLSHFNLQSFTFPTNVVNVAYIWDGSRYVEIGKDFASNRRTIPMLQGFWVQYTKPSAFSSAQLELTGDDAIIDNSNTFFKGEDYPLQTLYVKLTDQNNIEDHAIFVLNEMATEEFDALYDAQKLFGEATEHYLYFPNEDLGTLFRFGFPEINKDLIVPLGLQIPTDGEYSLSFENASSFLTGAYTLYLYDSFNNTTELLEEHSSFTFSLEAGTHEQRFSLLVDYDNVAISETNKHKNISFFYYNNQLIFDESLPNGTFVDVLNLSGQKVRSVSGSGLSKISLELTSGLYIITVKNSNFTQCDKIIVP